MTSHTVLCKNLNPGVNEANIEQGAANYVLENLLRDVWFPGHKVRTCMYSS